MAKKTIKSIKRELKRCKSAEKRLRIDLKAVLDEISANGGLSDRTNPKRTVNPALRQLREVKKSLETVEKYQKQLAAELVALEAAAREDLQDAAYLLDKSVTL